VNQQLAGRRRDQRSRSAPSARRPDARCTAARTRRSRFVNSGPASRGHPTAAAVQEGLQVIAADAHRATQVRGMEFLRTHLPVANARCTAASGPPEGSTAAPADRTHWPASAPSPSAPVPRRRTRRARQGPRRTARRSDGSQALRNSRLSTTGTCPTPHPRTSASSAGTATTRSRRGGCPASLRRRRKCPTALPSSPHGGVFAPGITRASQRRVARGDRSRTTARC
jgi:hypothetical protein